MGKTYDSLNDQLKQFITEQKMFFVGTAPLSADGLVNLSPKGLDSLRILDDRTVAYCDLTGSGIETVAHVKENGRMVMMFCSFDSRPLIVRLHGRGEIVEGSDPGFDELAGLFPTHAYVRAIVKLHVERVADSCGWGVPKYEFIGQRDTYARFGEQRTAEDVQRAQLKNNMKSLDGLPGLKEPSV